MCAIVSSAVSRSVWEKEHKRKSESDDDDFLCTQYTFTMTSVSAAESGGRIQTALVPIAFCGWHHPQREVDHVGLPPHGGGYVSAKVRVPPKRPSTTKIAAEE